MTSFPGSTGRENEMRLGIIPTFMKPSVVPLKHDLSRSFVCPLISITFYYSFEIVDILSKDFG